MTPTRTSGADSDRPLEVRRKLQVRGREDVRLFLIVTVLCDRVFLRVDPPLESDIAILDPPQVDSLIGILTWAARTARAAASTPATRKDKPTEKNKNGE